MELATDARRAVPALVDLFYGRPWAVSRFNLTRAGFWRVFWLVLGGLAAVTVAWTGLTAAGEALPTTLEATLVALSVLGGSAAAMQIILAMGELEEWRCRALAFLVPLLWIGGAFWCAGAALSLLWRGLGVGPALPPEVWAGLGLCAAFGAWRAARLGLKVSRGSACGVVFVYACAEFAGYAVVNATLWFT